MFHVKFIQAVKNLAMHQVSLSAHCTVGANAVPVSLKVSNRNTTEYLPLTHLTKL